MGEQRKIPDWLYEGLPYFYLAVGLLTIVALRNAIAMFSGLTLVSAGVIVWVARRQNRRRPDAARGPHSRWAEPAAPTTRPMSEARGKPGAVVKPENVPAVPLNHLSWRAAYETGNAVIDAQHRRLFGIGNQLIDAVLANRGNGDLERLLDDLVRHLTDHFCTEEAMLAKSRHPLSPHHQEVHRGLLTRAQQLRDRFESGAADGRELVGFIFNDVILDHLIHEDARLKSRPTAA